MRPGSSTGAGCAAGPRLAAGAAAGLFGRRGRWQRGSAFGDLAEQRAEADGLAGLATISKACRRQVPDFDGHLVGFELESGSSALTASPTFLNQVPTVASLTDSPRVGTRISVAMFILISRLMRFKRPAAAG
jgi:hypothetical protein